MTRFVGTPLTGVEFKNLGDEAFSARTTGDASPRLRIDAGGRITWSAGESGGEVNLYRSSADTLATDDIFYAPAGVITLTTEGPPEGEIADGAVAVDTENDVLYFRSQNQWIKSSTSTVVIAEEAPETGRNGDLWFSPNGNVLYIYSSGDWVAIAGESLSLDDLTDVSISDPQIGDLLAFDGTSFSNTSFVIGAFGNFDGGSPESVYGGISPIDGGSPEL